MNKLHFSNFILPVLLLLMRSLLCLHFLKVSLILFHSDFAIAFIKNKNKTRNLNVIIDTNEFLHWYFSKILLNLLSVFLSCNGLMAPSTNFNKNKNKTRLFQNIQHFYLYYFLKKFSEFEWIRSIDSIRWNC